MFQGSKRQRLSIHDSSNEDHDSDSLDVHESSKARSRSRSQSHSPSTTRILHVKSSTDPNLGLISTETDSIIGMKQESSVNDSDEGSTGPASLSPSHTPSLTSAFTPQRSDTPVPENLSLRKTASPTETSIQTVSQTVDLVQHRYSPQPPSLAVSLKNFN